MQFGEKLRELRTQQKWSQTEAAALIGVSLRTYQNYESCRMYPEHTALYGKIAELFHVSADYLLNDEDHYLIDAQERGDESSRNDVEALIHNANALFAGGELSEEDKEKVIRTLNDLYWKARDKNRMRGEE